MKLPPEDGIWVRSNGEEIQISEMKNAHILPAYEIQRKKVRHTESMKPSAASMFFDHGKSGHLEREAAWKAEVAKWEKELASEKSLLVLMAEHIVFRGFQTDSVICDYCDEPAVLVDSSIVYKRSYGPIWYCHEDQAWVGCHPNTEIALGTLANKQLRNARKRCKRMLNSLWMPEGAPMKRSEAYKWLSEAMDLRLAKTYVGMFNIEQCNLAYDLVQAYFRRMRQNQAKL